METIREPLIVLTSDLKVITANRSFYEMFHVTLEETEGRFVYSIGDHAWDIPALRELLEEIIPQNTYFNNFEVDQEFPVIGHKIMLLNARRIIQKEIGSQMILLAIEDITEKMSLERELVERTRDAEKAQSEAEAATRATENIVETVREPLLVLTADLKVITANRSFYEMFHVTPKETEGRFVYSIGDLSLDFPAFFLLQCDGFFDIFLHKR